MEGTSVGQVSKRKVLMLVGSVALAVALILWLWPRGERPNQQAANTKTEHADEHGGEAKQVELSPEALAAAGIETATVVERPAVALLHVTGTVEANQQQMQQVTPLVTGRVERVHVALGDRVRAGAVLAVISSPQIAEMHGKLHEAETRLALAERTLARVQQAENRAGVLQAKARLEETEATLRRTQRLIELGAGAGKDLVTAETAHKMAKAEYDFQSNISLNREVQQAQAEVETSRVEVSHLENSLRSLGADTSEGGVNEKRHDTSVVALRSPISGTITERLVNAGAGIEAGKPLFTVANISTLWVIANVPEAQVGYLHVGTPAAIRSAAVGATALAGRINYIDPRLDEGTRTARVRIEVVNPGERLKVGMFVEVGFEANTKGTETVSEMVVPEEAIQRIGDRYVVFIPEEGKAGHFKVREVQVGGESAGYHSIKSGLKLGEQVVTKGSFTLKTQLLKGELGEH